MADETTATPMDQRYLKLLADLIERYLKGEFLSQEMIQDALQTGLDTLLTMGEVAQLDRVDAAMNSLLAQLQQAQQAQGQDEFQQVKGARRLKALKTLQSVWGGLQDQYRTEHAIATAMEAIVTAEPVDRLGALIAALDPNLPLPLLPPQLAQLAQQLSKRQTTLAHRGELDALIRGIQQGLASCRKLQEKFMGWAFGNPQQSSGFGQSTNPWDFWASQLAPPPPKVPVGFMALDVPPAPKVPPSLTQSCLQAIGQPSINLQEWATQASTATADWVELILVLRFLQQSLVQWSDNQAYDPTVGPKLSISTFWTFASLWSEFSQGLREAAPGLSAANFQLLLQVLRSFARQSYFPLYGGVYTSFSGSYLRFTLQYLQVSLTALKGTQETARVLTLLGYSQRAFGQYEIATDFHQEALDLAREAGDIPCEIASLNHLGRTCIAVGDYTTAVDHSQRALLLSRQNGDRLGEVNALANLGYSQVFVAKQDQAGPEVYEQAIAYLQRGLTLATQYEDAQSQALCQTSLGIALLVTGQAALAIPSLQAGLQAAQRSGDLYLQGLNRVQLANAHQAVDDNPQAIYCGLMGMYLLHQIQAPEWRQPIGLLLILRGQYGEAGFTAQLQSLRSQIIAEIGVDGYDALLPLLDSAP